MRPGATIFRDNWMSIKTPQNQGLKVDELKRSREFLLRLVEPENHRQSLQYTTLFTSFHACTRNPHRK